jgi:excisionase family DNA binding protein
MATAKKSPAVVKRASSSSGRFVEHAAGTKPSGKFTSTGIVVAKKGVTVARSAPGFGAGTVLRDKPAGKMAGMVLTHPKTNRSAAGWVLPPLALDTKPLLDAVKEHVALPASAARSLKKAFNQLLSAQVGRIAQAATLAEVDPVLSTQEAADLAGVSRPFLAARIDTGDIPLHQMVGNQRRVLRSAVLAWQERMRAGQRQGLARLGAELDDEIFSH